MVDLQENTIPVVAQHQYGRLVTARQMTWNDNRTREVGARDTCHHPRNSTYFFSRKQKEAHHHSSSRRAYRLKKSRILPAVTANDTKKRNLFHHI